MRGCPGTGSQRGVGRRGPLGVVAVLAAPWEKLAWHPAKQPPKCELAPIQRGGCGRLPALSGPVPDVIIGGFGLHSLVGSYPLSMTCQISLCLSCGAELRMGEDGRKGRGEMRWGGWRGAGFFYLQDSCLQTLATGASIAFQPLQGDLLMVKWETAGEQVTECI